MTKRKYTFTPIFVLEVDNSGNQVNIDAAWDWGDSFNSIERVGGEIFFNTVDDLDVRVLNLFDAFIDANEANWREAFSNFSNDLKKILQLQIPRER